MLDTIYSPLPRCMREAPPLDASIETPAPTPRHALLINPFYAKDPNASFGKHVLTPTLALTSIAGSTPANWTVRYWDENLLKGPASIDPFPEVVGITVHLTFARRAFELAHWYRVRGAKVIFGGLHVLSRPDECAPHADALALGEGVRVWPQILHDVEHGTLQKRYAGDYALPYRDEPAPLREILPRQDFLTNCSMIATRGCHNRCEFCYLSTDGLRIPYQCRDVGQVIDEFAGSGEPYGVFIDNNLGSKPAYLRELCRALRPLEKIWSAAVSIDVADDPSLIREMALAGCTGVFIGFESLTAENIVDARKRSPRPDDYGRRVALFHKYGIQVNGSFVLGFDHDKPTVFADLAQWIEDNRLECATFHIMTPYPGTPLFRQMEREGRLLHKNWELYDTAHVVFRPKHMTPAQLENGYRWLYWRLFRADSIWRRRPRSWGAVPAYLAMSLLYKRANWMWPWLIRCGLTHRVWSPVVEMSRRRHVRFRKTLADESAPECSVRAPVAAGV